MNELILFPVSGLGNRIAAIESAICLAEKRDFDMVTILWDQTTVPCSFDELIQVHSDKCKIKIKTILGGNKNNICSRVIHGVMLRLYSFGACKDFPLLDGGVCGKMEPDEFPTSGRIYLRACTEFYPFDRIRHVFFKQEEVGKAIASLPDYGRCIGVHIRRGDNYNSSTVSKTELFLDRISQEIEKDPDVFFFLATDDESVQKELIEQFPGHIFVQNEKSNERYSSRGQHEAAIDMIALSKTEYIIGSFYSSFTDMAAKIGNIRAEIVGKQIW